jgi:hypothetical protein
LARVIVGGATVAVATAQRVGKIIFQEERWTVDTRVAKIF